MLSKELEILKIIEELYVGDISDDDFIKKCKGKDVKLEAWKEAFEDYPLYEVSKAINHFYVRKSSKTKPNIAQIRAILQENNATREVSPAHSEKIEPSFGIKFMEQDKTEGNMHWFVPDYMRVERLIADDYWTWIYNIKNPTIDEFHRCIEEWCLNLTGHKYRFYSENDIKKMTDEQQGALWKKCREKIDSFKVNKIN